MSRRHRLRPSTERQVEDTRWVRNKQGHWRHKTDIISEVAFCQRATREAVGFYHGGMISARR